MKQNFSWDLSCLLRWVKKRDDLAIGNYVRLTENTKRSDNKCSCFVCFDSDRFANSIILRMVKVNMKQSNFLTANGYYRKILKDVPGSPIVMAHLGTTYYHMKDWSTASKIFKKVICWSHPVWPFIFNKKSILVNIQNPPFKNPESPMLITPFLAKSLNFSMMGYIDKNGEKL